MSKATQLPELVLLAEDRDSPVVFATVHPASRCLLLCCLRSWLLLLTFQWPRDKTDSNPWRAQCPRIFLSWEKRVGALNRIEKGGCLQSSAFWLTWILFISVLGLFWVCLRAWVWVSVCVKEALNWSLFWHCIKSQYTHSLEQLFLTGVHGSASGSWWISKIVTTSEKRDPKAFFRSLSSLWAAVLENSPRRGNRTLCVTEGPLSSPYSCLFSVSSLFRAPLPR